MTSKRPNRKKHNSTKTYSAAPSKSKPTQKLKNIDLRKSSGPESLRKFFKSIHIQQENGYKLNIAAILFFIQVTNTAKFQIIKDSLKYIKKNLRDLKIKKLSDHQKALRLKRILIKTRIIAVTGLHSNKSSAFMFNKLIDAISCDPSSMLTSWSDEKSTTLKIWIDRIYGLSSKPLPELLRLLKKDLKQPIVLEKFVREDFLPLLFAKICEANNIEKTDLLRCDDVTTRIESAFKNYKI